MRRERERSILAIVEEEPVHTQAQLVAALEERGFTVTQATVSRDIKRLGIAKVPTPEGSYRYASPGAASGEEGGGRASARETVRAALDEFATAVAGGESLLAIRTHSGCANAVAVAIDEARLPGVVATLAGDDTILVLTRTLDDRDRLLGELSELVPG